MAKVSLAFALLACSREMNIRDEPEAGVNGNSGVLMPDGGIPALDAGLGTDAFASCELRREGDCRGTNDFACAFDGWARAAARDCQVLTGCVTNGWVRVDMGDDGCVSEIGMEADNPDYAACLVASFGAYRCPCSARQITHLLGFANAGCADAGALPCRGGEFPCPPGYACTSGVCVADEGGGGAPSE